MAEIRELRADEHEFLREMLYECIFVPEGAEKFPRSILEDPAVARYLVNFGRDGDTALVACDGAELVGAAWARLFTEKGKSFAFIDEQTPELGIAVVAAHRGRGTGTRLLAALLLALEAKGFAQVSLSVDRRNRAAALYPRFGFETVAEEGTALTMLKRFQPL